MKFPILLPIESEEVQTLPSKEGLIYSDDFIQKVLKVLQYRVDLDGVLNYFLARKTNSSSYSYYISDFFPFSSIRHEVINGDKVSLEKVLDSFYLTSEIKESIRDAQEQYIELFRVLNDSSISFFYSSDGTLDFRKPSYIISESTSMLQVSPLIALYDDSILEYDSTSKKKLPSSEIVKKYCKEASESREVFFVPVKYKSLIEEANFSKHKIIATLDESFEDSFMQNVLEKSCFTVYKASGVDREHIREIKGVIVPFYLVSYTEIELTEFKRMKLDDFKEMISNIKFDNASFIKVEDLKLYKHILKFCRNSKTVRSIFSDYVKEFIETVDTDLLTYSIFFSNLFLGLSYDNEEILEAHCEEDSLVYYYKKLASVKNLEYLRKVYRFSNQLGGGAYAKSEQIRKQVQQLFCEYPLSSYITQMDSLTLEQIEVLERTRKKRLDNLK